MDFGERPYIVIWEMTQACDLACVHCRACAIPTRHPRELSTAEGKQLIDQVAELQAPVFVLTGGDPLKRPDICQLVEYATNRGVRTSLSPSATPLLTRRALVELKRAGLARMAVSLDGPNAQVHDAFRGVGGSFAITLQALRWSHELGIPLQINSTLSRRNFADFDELAHLVEVLDIVLWSVFFLVPTGRGQSEGLLTAPEFEEIFHKLYLMTHRVRFDIKTTEAMHYRRVVAQARAAQRRRAERAQAVAGATPGEPRPSGQEEVNISRPKSPDQIGRAPRGINDAKGFVFISHLGDVFPSGFLPIVAGNIRNQSLAEIYQRSPLFVALRDTSKLKGKCGVCEFREICGGSRARAYALTSDPFAEEPCCVYQPKTTEVAAA